MTRRDITRQYHIQQERAPHLRHWQQLIKALGKRGMRFVEIRPGAKLPTRTAWNQTANTLTTEQALALIGKGDNIGGAGGTGHLYIIDFDHNAERGHESSHLAGGVYTYRNNAPDRAKYIICCPDPLPTRHDKKNGIDLIGFNANGTHAQATIAGIHSSGAPILWSGHTIPVLPAETVAALWEEWTGRQLFAPLREARDTDDTAANVDLALVADALEFVDPNDPEMDYTSWIGIIAAVRDAFDGSGDALALMVEWADGKPGEVEAKWQSFDREYTGRPTTLKSLFYFARRGGWIDPLEVSAPAPLPEGAEVLDNGTIVIRTTPTPEPPKRPKLPACTPALCAALRQGVNSPEGRELLCAFKNREVYLAALCVLLTKAPELGGWTISITTRELGEILSKSHKSASRNMHALDRLDIVNYHHTATQNEVGDAAPMCIDLSPLVYKLLDVTGVSDGANVTELTIPYTCDVYARYACNGEFADATMRANPMIKGLHGRTLRPLNSGVLNGIDFVARGELAFTRREFEEKSGMSKSSVVGMTRICVELGIATVEKVGRSNEYIFSPDWREQLDALVPKMTSFLALDRLKIRNVSDRIVEVERHIRRRGGDPKQVREDDSQAIRDLHTRRKKMLFARKCLMEDMEAKDLAHRPQDAAAPQPQQWVGTPQPRSTRGASTRNAARQTNEGDLIERRLALYATARESKEMAA